MPALHEDHDQSLPGLAPHDHPVLREVEVDQTLVYSEEIRRLRQRVAVLEAALAESEASRQAEAIPTHVAPPLTSIDLPPSRPTPVPPALSVTSEFAPPLAPAVVSVVPAPASPQVAAGAEQPAGREQQLPVSETPKSSFSANWDDDEPSFEERIAERVFFRASTVDEQSRSWLLDS